MKPRNFTTTLILNQKLADNTYLLSFQLEDNLEFIPGQFLMLDVEKQLRRPFAIFDFNSTTRILSILIKEKGSGTSSLLNKAINSKIEILAPLGNGYSLQDNKQENILLAGGIGLASVFPLIKLFNIKQIPFTVILGYKTKSEIPEISSLKNVIIYTEDGSSGQKGYPTDFLKTKSNLNIFACGPHALVKSLEPLKEENNILVSLEEKMGCGVGACLSCVVKTKDGLKRVCKDGPVFNIKNLINL